MAGTPTVCTGTTVGGVVASNSGVISIEAGASLTRGTTDPAAVLITSTGVYPSPPSTVTLNVQGEVDGGSGVGVLLRNEMTGVYYSNTTANILVGADGVITGSTAILLDGAGASSYLTGTFASLDNSGEIRSTSGGPAIVALPVDRVALRTVTNRASGFIGGIQGTVQTLDNAGVIDGGTGSAYSYPTANSYIGSVGTVTNTGTMRSASASATVDAGGYLSLVNSGLIANTSGVALAATRGFNVENKAGGIIQGGGAVAIDGGDGGWGFTLVNRGTINGSVLASSLGDAGANVDNVGGTINGDLLFGSGRDTLIAGYGQNGVDYGVVTGRIDGGGGVNTVRVVISQDRTADAWLSSPVLPTNFQRAQLALSNDVTLTFNGDIGDGLYFAGQGTVLTTGVVQTTGTAFSSLYAPFDTGLKFKNTGEITAQLGAPLGGGAGAGLETGYAVYFTGLAGFTNTGKITGVNGYGVYASIAPQNFLNTGEITASGYALTVSGGFVNDGLVQSTQDTGVWLTLGGGTVRSITSTNNGKILGVTNGAVLSSVTLANNGQITASSGVGVAMGHSSTLFNGAKGVITGTTNSLTASSSAIVRNAGVLNGDVNLVGVFSDSTDIYFDDGGVLNGSLYLGSGYDFFITDLSRFKDGKFVGVTGVVDGGAGNADTLLLRVASDTTNTIADAAGFERLALSLENGAAAKLTINKPWNDTLYLSGKGSLDLTADINANSGTSPILTTSGPLVSLTNGYSYAWDTVAQLSIVSRGALVMRQPVTGYISSAIQLSAASSFENAGSLTVQGQKTSYSPVIAIDGGDRVVNSGTISVENATAVSGAKSFLNTGSLTQTAASSFDYGVNNVLTVENRGTISTVGTSVRRTGWTDQPFTVTNSGAITSSAGTAIESANSYTNTVVTNVKGATISGAVAAIDTGSGADVIRNDGTITGLIRTGYGDDRIENYGSITGRVELGDGNDTFVQWVGGSMTGVVDGGFGLDTLTIDSTGGGKVTGAQFLNFERFTQIGDGGITYAGAFSADTIRLEGGKAIVEAGTTVSTTGYTSVFSGGDGSEQVENAGVIAGSVSLGGGADAVVNRGTINGSLLLGAGDDVFTEGAGSTVLGAIDGGTGSDTYIVELAGDRAGLTARTSFERLGVQGAGRLTLTLDQNWESVSLDGAGLALTSAGYTVGAVSGGGKADALTSDIDIASINLGAGDDSLTLAGASFTGLKLGGAGADVLTFTSTAPVTLGGQVSGFETINLAGGALSVTGSLGAAGDTIAFGAGNQTLTVLGGAVLDGTVDLGAGDDVLQLAAGGVLAGTVLGGAGSDQVSIDLVSDLSLRGDQLQQFEILEVTGTGALNFTGGAAKFDRLVTSSLTLSVGAGSSLASGDVVLGADNNTVTVGGAFQGRLDLGAGDDVLRLTSGGSFSGSAEGGLGRDRVELAVGGTDAAPTAFGTTGFTGFETLAMQSGVASLAGAYGFETIQVSGGRLIGLAGSRLTGSVTVAQGATFGSAGAVVGDVVVNGTLSPGASPGTMTVTGNLALGAASTSLFELSPSASDKLVVSGKVTIAQGATLKLTGAAATLTPGRRLDLIVAGGGITGSYATIQGGEGLNLRFNQSATRLEALGLFTTNASFSREVSGLVETLNSAFIADKAGAAAVAAMPLLVDQTTGASNAAALARVTPQAYASAAQLAAEDGLAIVDTLRAQSRFAPEEAGLFGFGQAFTGRRDFDGDAQAGVAAGKTDGTGVIGGVGYGLASAWGGAFVGYVDGRQRIGALDARTELDSFVVGVTGRVELGGLALAGTAAHDRADTQTRRMAPGGVQATGDYKLKSWAADVNLSYPMALNGDWAVRPSLGASYVRTKRGDLVERGGGAFALTLESETVDAWFVDGQVELRGGQATGARVHPFVSAGFRSRVGGDAPAASGRIAGLDADLVGQGLRRDKTLGLVGAGLDYDVSERLSVSTAYSGEFGDGGRQAALVGLNWKF
ncbi:hypothetical protein [Caulobacter endophyticus]|uniref:hypothetical protein n=1 Tax=Caulobacter endophyticus TaxID=2172652 RepID=UPI00240EA161|nr:hypothetical protein [Caulobacter endophyticus]MDG2531671.1 hypothetical protein [Caulobacter endophyticus]